MSTGARLLPLLSLSHAFILPSPTILPHLILLQIHLSTLADLGLREAFRRQRGGCRPEQQSKDAEGSRAPCRQWGGGQDPSPGQGTACGCACAACPQSAKETPSEPELSSAKTLSPSPLRQQEFILTRVSPRDGPFPCPCPAGPGLPATLHGFKPPGFPAIRCCLL